MTHPLLRYLFPPRSYRNKLPLLSKEYSSKIGPEVPANLKLGVDMLKGHAVARTDQDALRLIRRYPGKSIRAIIKAEKRKRRPKNRWVRAWQRLKRLW
jgi:hypothetical protein